MIYRLPTEAEWEFSCLSGANSPFSFGEVSQAGDFAWSAENSDDKTQFVGKKQANACIRLFFAYKLGFIIRIFG